ncbi:MAG: hypothetical protein LIP01_04465 [Tannerellaceae bacterium]|nr:hypothetical protein [Tannerellaceae bacterium]
MKRVLLIYGKYFVLILYIAYYGSILFFSHLHIDESGIYTHSHPFQSSRENEPHQHDSSPALQLINDLSTFQIDGNGIEIYSIHRFIPPVLNVICTTDTAANTTSCFTRYSLRAPPKEHISTAA